MQILKTILVLTLLTFSFQRQVRVYFNNQDFLSWSSNPSGPATNSYQCESDSLLDSQWFLQINSLSTFIWKDVAIPEPHYAIYLTYQFYFQYQWSSEDRATVQIDNGAVVDYGRKTSDDNNKHCLSNSAGYWESGYGTYDSTWDHTTSSAQLRIGINFNSEVSKRLFVNKIEMLIYYCDYNCASCNGEASNNCLSCRPNMYLSSGTCYLNSYLQFVDLTDGGSQFMVSSTGAYAPIVTCNSPQGVYYETTFREIAKNTYGQRVFRLNAHYKIGIFVQYQYQGQWNNEQVYIQVDGTNIFSSYKYYRSMHNECLVGTNSYADSDSEFIYRETTHSATSATIRLGNGLVSGTSTSSVLLFREFKLYIFICHESCLTCNGPLSTDCLTCYTNFYHLSGTSCVLNDYIGLMTFPSGSSGSGWSDSGTFTCNTGEYSGLTFYYSTNNNNFVSKAYNIYRPHYKIGASVFLYHLKEWTSFSSYFKIDDTTTPSSWAFSSYNSDSLDHWTCSAGWVEYDYIADGRAEWRYSDILTHTANEVTIKIGNTETGAINRSTTGWKSLNIYIFYCDMTCASCNGPLANNCLTCYSYHVISSGYCVLTSDYWVSVVYFQPDIIYPQWSQSASYIVCSQGVYKGEKVIQTNSNPSVAAEIDFLTHRPHYKIGIELRTIKPYQDWDGSNAYMQVGTVSDTYITHSTSAYKYDYGMCTSDTAYSGSYVLYSEQPHTATTLKLYLWSSLSSYQQITQVKMFTFHCHWSCKSCTNYQSNACDSCYTYYTLSGGVCIIDSTLGSVELQFYTGGNRFSNNNKITCDTGIWKGIQFNKLNCYNCSAEFTFYLPRPHYKVAAKIQVILQENWSSDSLYIYLNNGNTNLWNSGPTYSYTQRNYYACQNSGATVYDGDSFVVEHEITYTTLDQQQSESVTLSIGNNAESDTSIQSLLWSQLRLIVFYCDDTCKTCDGPASNQCTSCRLHFTLTSGSCAINSGVVEMIFSDANVGWQTPAPSVQCNTGIYNKTFAQYIPYNGMYISKTFRVPRAHWKVGFTMRIMHIGSWDTESSYFKIADSADATATWSVTRTWSHIDYYLCKQIFCATMEGGIDVVEIYGTHTDSVVTVQVGNGLDQDYHDEGTHFTNLKLYVYYCDESCATCNGQASTNCVTCQPNYVISSGSCILQDSIVTTYTFPDGGDLSSGSGTVIACDTGIFKGLSFTRLDCNNCALTKTMNVDRPHYKAAVQADILHQFNWNAQRSYVKIDNSYYFDSVQSFQQADYWYCVASGVTQPYEGKFIRFYKEIPHSSSSLSVTIGNAAETSWDSNTLREIYRNVRFFIFYCHETCLTCSGPSNNECKSCWDPNMLLQDGVCMANPNQLIQTIDYDGSGASFSFTTTFTCTEGQYNGLVFSKITNNGGWISRTYTTSQPHYKIAASYYIYYAGYWATSNSLEESLAGTTTQNAYSSATDSDGPYCTSGIYAQEGSIIRRYSEVAHTAGSADVNIYYEAYNSYRVTFFKNLVFTIFLCHPTCSACTGPNPWQCTACQSGTLVVNTCKITDDYYIDSQHYADYLYL